MWSIREKRKPLAVFGCHFHWRFGDCADEWLPDDVNEGHLDYFFFLLAGLMVVNLLIYIPVAHFYKYAPTNK